MARREQVGGRGPAAAVVAVAVAVAVAAAGVVPLGCGRPAPPATDFQRDLAALEQEGVGARDGGGTGRAVWLQRRWALTGDADQLVAASQLLDQACAAGGSSPPLWLLSAMVALDGHRLADARRLLDGLAAAAPELVDAPLVVLVGGDLALQEGRWQEAEAAYTHALASRREWDALARLAYLRAVQGDGEAADRLYAEAEEQLDAKEMRTLAWLEVQRGRIDFTHGRLQAARARYQRAARAYSGYWLVEARLAEVTAAMGQLPQALAAYEALAADPSHPDLAQALGELYTFAGQPARARPYYDRALAAYQRSVDRGEVHYLHQLATFHADISGDAAAAVHWAERDLALRAGTPSAHDQMAWALFRAGRVAEAREEIGAALRAATRDPHVLYHAALIAMAANDPDGARGFLQRIDAINPGYRTTFHAHN